MKFLSYQVFFVFFLLLFLLACTKIMDEDIAKNNYSGGDGCVYCHTQKERLQALTPAAETQGGEQGGFIGVVKPLQPWQKVYIDLGGKESPAQIDLHFARSSCSDCHKGDASHSNNKDKAHTGLIRDPSDQPNNVCGTSGCHEATADQFKNSMHQKLWGVKHAMALRSGSATFDQCPAPLKEGFNSECNGCHASCGDCHISIPNSAGSGLVQGHRFYQTPDMQNNCTACHGTRIGAEFVPNYNIGTVYTGDVHAKSAGFTCVDCHDKFEMHSAAEEGTDRYHYDRAPSCMMCHREDTGLATKNHYHQFHFDDLSCQVCHAQDYNNCTSCHVKGGWKKDPEYQANNPSKEFRIGRNPLSDRSQKFVTVRHIPIARVSYDNWGAVGSLSAYDDYPTWKFTTPHSIQRYTIRTTATGDQKCSQNCHISDDVKNKKYYLFESYIEENWPDEVDANKDVVVDGHLPDSWR
jgi:hypothetical protein